MDAAAEAVASPFPFAPRGTKGYSPAAVDDFLRLARAAFEAPAALPADEPATVDAAEVDLVVEANDDGDAAEPVEVEVAATVVGAAPAEFSSASVRHVSFALVRKGYSIGAVDAALARIEDAFAAREREATIAAVGTAEWV